MYNDIRTCYGVLNGCLIFFVFSVPPPRPSLAARPKSMFHSRNIHSDEGKLSNEVELNFVLYWQF